MILNIQIFTLQFKFKFSFSLICKLQEKERRTVCNLFSIVFKEKGSSSGVLPVVEPNPLHMYVCKFTSCDAVCTYEEFILQSLLRRIVYCVEEASFAWLRLLSPPQISLRAKRKGWRTCVEANIRSITTNGHTSVC